MIKANGIGHIGYEIIPSMRGKGYVTKGLHLLLDYAKTTLFLDEVMITFFANNLPSYKTASRIMQEYGGYEMKPIFVNGKQKRRFLIKTKR